MLFRKGFLKLKIAGKKIFVSHVAGQIVRPDGFNGFSHSPHSHWPIRVQLEAKNSLQGREDQSQHKKKGQWCLQQKPFSKLWSDLIEVTLHSVATWQKGWQNFYSPGVTNLLALCEWTFANICWNSSLILQGHLIQTKRTSILETSLIPCVFS